MDIKNYKLNGVFNDKMKFKCYSKLIICWFSMAKIKTEDTHDDIQLCQASQASQASASSSASFVCFCKWSRQRFALSLLIVQVGSGTDTGQFNCRRST